MNVIIYGTLKMCLTSDNGEEESLRHKLSRQKGSEWIGELLLLVMMCRLFKSISSQLMSVKIRKQEPREVALASKAILP